MKGMNKVVRKLKGCIVTREMKITLESWLEANNISITDFEGISGVPYQRISEHIRLHKPLSEKHVLKILEATDCKVSPEMLRPSLKPIFGLISNKRRSLLQRKAGFIFGMAIVLVIFAAMIFQVPTEFHDSVIAKSWYHYEEAKNAVSNGDLEFALSHLNAIEKRTPAWHESRELHQKVREDLRFYVQKRMQSQKQ